VLENGSTWLDLAADWQIADALAILDPDFPQKLHFLTRPRGGSKTSDLAGISISWLLEQAGPGTNGYVVAADADQAGELLLAAEGMLLRTPGLAGALIVEAERLVNPSTGAAMNVLAADGPGAFGKRPSFTVIDEAAQWADTKNARKVWTAMVSAVPKVPGGRLAILTTAGDPAHYTYKVLELARQDVAHWRVHELPGPLPWRSADDLAVQRGLLTDWEYERLHLNRWTAADDSLVDLDRLRACVVLDGPQPHSHLNSPYVIAVDLATRRDNCVVVACHAEPAGGVRRVVLDAMKVWTPTRGNPVPLEEVEETIASLSYEYAGAERSRHVGCRVVFDPAEGRLMADRLRTRGLPVEHFNFTTGSVGVLGSLLHQLLRDGLLALPDDDLLIDELAHVRLRETSVGGVRIDHDSGRHDDRAIAIALAAHMLLTPQFMPQPIDVASWTAPKNRYDYDLRAHSEPWESGSLLKVEF
jgi:phage terminase large subunit-like protein